MRSLGAFAMLGKFQAVAAISAIALVPVIFWAALFTSHPFIASLVLTLGSLVSASLLALVALRKGAKESAWVMLLSVMSIGLASAVLTGNALQGIFYGLLLWAPIWPIAIVLRETHRLEWALGVASGLGLAGVLGVYLLVDDPAAQWRERMNLQSMLENVPASLDAAAMAKVLESISHYMTGAMAGGFVFSLILPLLIARWQQSVLFNPGGFRAEFLTLRFHRMVGYAGLACIAAGLLGGGILAETAWNLSSVLMVLFTLGGFSVLHAFLGGKGFWMVGIYFALLVIPQLLLPPIALVGLSDVWLDWRKYLKRL